jgi:hypothetical protein
MENKYFKIISSTVIVGVFLLFAFGSGSAKKNEVKCDSSNEGYKSGYNAGKSSIWDTPEAYIRECNNGAGMIGEVPPCWNEGFRDGHSGN